MVYCGLVALRICLFECGFVQTSLPDRLTGTSGLKLQEFGWYFAHLRKSRSDPLVSFKWMHLFKLASETPLDIFSPDRSHINLLMFVGV